MRGPLPGTYVCYIDDGRTGEPSLRPPGFWSSRIIQLYGQEGTGYEVAVIYSCGEVLGITVNTVSGPDYFTTW